MANKSICSIAECGNATLALGLCADHLRGRKRQQSGDIVRDLLTSETDECILWPLSCDRYGYGRVRYEGNQIGAHRMMCTLVHGEPNGRIALHSCDTPACINPRHLRWGTRRENTQDAMIRFRFPVGEKNGQTKITEEAVREMRASDESARVLAKRYGIRRNQVMLIRNREYWKHIT